ncbi:unnamed protein product [Ranitomeya imitator]|uniref:Major facilitator superfamily (MFS) profile domain-containing protein n=1 Tax=Ranitomeya imitator TaxID=111125 RepID=A0ABN9L0S4_9NEOB|nr:unnamed protein product [Ranitomeya imitator]
MNFSISRVSILQLCWIEECKASVHRGTTLMAQETENEDPVVPIEKKEKLTSVLLLVTLVSTIGSSFQYGYNVASVNSPAPPLMTNRQHQKRLTWAKEKKNWTAAQCVVNSVVELPPVVVNGTSASSVYGLPLVAMSEAAASEVPYTVNICGGLPLPLGNFSEARKERVYFNSDIFVPLTCIGIGYRYRRYPIFFRYRPIQSDTDISEYRKFMQNFYNETYLDRYGSWLSKDLETILWSLTVSLYPLGGFFGSLLVGPMVNKIGRKGTLLVNNIFSIVPAILMGTSVLSKSFEVIIASRLVIGICAGLSSNVVPMYLGEMSPKNLRGAIGVMPQLLITIGILMAQIFGIRVILGNSNGWPILLALTGIPAVMQLILLPFFPESPRYTLLQKGKEDEAKKALQRLRGCDDVDNEIKEMYQEDQSEKAEGRLSVGNLCSFRPLRWQLISIIVMNMGQQLSGINAYPACSSVPAVFPSVSVSLRYRANSCVSAVYYYADTIYAQAGVPDETVQYVTVATGSVNVLMTLAAIFIVDSWGRRLLLLLGFGICCTACVVLTIALVYQRFKRIRKW